MKYRVKLQIVYSYETEVEAEGMDAAKEQGSARAYNGEIEPLNRKVKKAVVTRMGERGKSIAE